MGHLINRTSPKGEPFVGTCSKCGRSGLRIGDVNGECENQRGLSQEETILEAVRGDIRKSTP